MYREKKIVENCILLYTRILSKKLCIRVQRDDLYQLERKMTKFVRCVIVFIVKLTFAQAVMSTKIYPNSYSNSSTQA